MQQWYQCPRCGAQVAFGVGFCGNCRTPLNWPTQQQPPPQYQQPQQTPQYQQPYQQPGGGYQQQVPPNYQHASSICVKCRYQNYHGIDHNGEATVTCQSCSTVYNVKTYEVRAKGGRRDRTSGIKSYNVRVKEPDRDETLLEFASTQEIEMRAGDWITGSYSEGKLKYLLNQKIRQYWDVQYGTEIPKKKTNVWLMGCLGVIVLAAIIGGIALAVGTSSPGTSLSTPSDIVSKVKVGMTIADVMGVVDIDKLTLEKAFVVVNCNSLSFNNDVIDYEATKDIDSPYFMWLCFGSVVQNLNPAVIGFSANPEMVIGTGRIDFAEAQTLVEWNSGRPFRR